MSDWQPVYPTSGGAAERHEHLWENGVVVLYADDGSKHDIRRCGICGMGQRRPHVVPLRDARPPLERHGL